MLLLEFVQMNVAMIQHIIFKNSAKNDLPLSGLITRIQKGVCFTTVFQV